MEDVKKTRLENFRRLLKSYGSQADIADRLGVTSAYISHLLSGYRAIGEKTARKIENATGKPHLWLDQKDTLTDKQKEVIRKIRDFPEEHLYALSAFVDSLSQANRKNR